MRILNMPKSVWVFKAEKVALGGYTVTLKII